MEASQSWQLTDVTHKIRLQLLLEKIFKIATLKLNINKVFEMLL